MDRGDVGDADGKRSGLASLSITGFRGIDHLRIPRLGRVTLLAGKNGVGKTTVLDAVRVYAARGRFDALRAALVRHEEVTGMRYEDGGLASSPALDRLFHQSGATLPRIEIGPVGGGPTLKIEKVKDHADVPDELYDKLVDDLNDPYNDDLDLDEIGFLSVVFDGTQVFLPWQTRLSSSRKAFLRAQRRMPAATPCEPFGPELPNSEHMAKLWYNVALSEDEMLALSALRLVIGNRVERAAVVGQGSDRRVLVKLSDSPGPAPLRSLGDGAIRMFGIALALTNFRDGFLLMDEAENGIHYSLHYEFWNMVLQSAEKQNVQVLATTHSKDCINGFAAAALDSPGISSNLVRIGRRNGELRAVGYSIEELETAAEQNIEVR